MPEITDPKVEQHLWYELGDTLFRDPHPGAQLLKRFLRVFRAGGRQKSAKLLIVGSGIENWQAMSLVRMDGRHLSTCFIYVKPNERGEDMFYRLLEEIHNFGAKHHYNMFGVPCPLSSNEGPLRNLHDIFGPPRAVSVDRFELPEHSSSNTFEPTLEILYYTLPRRVLEEELLL